MSQQVITVKKNPKVFNFLTQTKKRINLLYGSAGSGKSWAIAQFLLFKKMLGEAGNRILVTRATGPALKKSCWLLISDLIAKYDLTPLFKTNKADMTITAANGSQMFFAPLDDAEKLKSYERMNYVWAEEATELSRDEYLQLNLRCRGENKFGDNQMFFSFNPIDENSFLKPMVDAPAENIGVSHSTYKDNKFLEQAYIDELERLQEVDEVYWKIYGLGMWASPTNMIYKNWDIIDEYPADDWFDDIVYGLDFGFNNPTALLKIGFKDLEIYWKELIYTSGITTTDLRSMIKELVPAGGTIVADPSRPECIAEIENDGYNIKGASREKNSVSDGIALVQRHKIHISVDSPETIKEIKGYKWKEDRNGNVLDEPVKWRDHTLDAGRYGMYEHLSGYLEPSIIWIK